MNRNKIKNNAISLFSGAGGMDVGFKNAGFDVLWANDADRDACDTYRENFGEHIVLGDINNLLNTLDKYKNIDCLFGGPPCQGFSVAGNMDPNDERSKLVMSYMEAVSIVKPKVFVMENVKALASLSKFSAVRENIIKKAHGMGYNTEMLILNSKDFGVPQSRERMFLIGFKNKKIDGSLNDNINKFKKESKTVKETIIHLGPAGSALNKKTVNAKISIASSPILRKSAYAGMLFNGQGRPINPYSHSSTLHASMGGNRTPIIDEDQLYNDEKSWVEEYHSHLINGGEPYPSTSAPSRLRRLTVDEAHLLQTFPKDFIFKGKQSSVFKQIGNAVPCSLAESVANLVNLILNGESSPSVIEKENLDLIF
ncbi:DNA cytosine methyltransferase [Rouxiella sp. Mn2063]|uniref:DNA cytosine methyltransferase n=1 Tax=Rouxiella sp. Mn2063 TaxID=3395262 RepID=UPI003BD2FF9B